MPACQGHRLGQKYAARAGESGKRINAGEIVGMRVVRKRRADREYQRGRWKIVEGAGEAGDFMRPW
jgi:hypothetical protein